MKKIVLIMLALATSCSQGPKEAIVIGIGGPLTGPRAQSGQSMKEGIDLALEEINASGGIHGRPLEIDFQDDQGDPKQALTLANKFIANPEILLASELGSSPSMSVAPSYQRGGLTLFAFASIHPASTDAGDYIWSNAPSMNKEAMAHASFVKDLGLKKVAFFSVDNEVGKLGGDLLEKSLLTKGIVALRETYLPDENDFRPLFSKVKTQGVDGFVLVSFLKDGSLLVRQLREAGLTLPIVASGLLATNKFPQLAGSSCEGTYIAGHFSVDDPRPEVVTFVKKWKAKYPEKELEYFSVHAYDSTILSAEVLKLSDGKTRISVKEAFAKIKNVPSVLYSKVTFDPVTRRVEDFLGARLVVKNKKIVRWEK